MVDYDDATIRDALNRLGHRRWTRLTSGPGSRAPKFRHLLDEALPLPPAQRAVLTVLMLRGPQTPGELKQRADRMHPFGDLGAVHETLAGLIGRDLAQQLPRQPGHKEERYGHRLGDDALDEAPARRGDEAPAAPAPRDDRVARLEAEVSALREQVRALRERLG